MTKHSIRSFWSLPFVAAATAFGVSHTSASASTIFVNASTGLPLAFQTGASWVTAYKDLQTAIAQSTSGDDIWVAKGTYKPTSGTSRTVSFAPKNGVRVLGGFLAGAPTLADRDPVANQTILSGDIGAATNADNSFHVVKTNSNVSTATVLAGFVITGGNANGSGNDAFGGGLDNFGSPRVVDCVFVNNNATNGGGGMHSAGVFDVLPAGIFNCVFEGNSATVGAAVEVQNGPVWLLFCTIVNNAGGGVRYLNAGAVESQVDSCIIRGNTGSGTILEQQVKVFEATVSFATDNITGGAALGAFCIDADPHFVDPDGADGIVGNIDDNLRLRGDSPCIDKASTSAIPADVADLDGDGSVTDQLSLDLGGVARRTEDTLVPNGAVTVAPGPDIGAFEYKRSRTVLVNLNATGANNGTSWTDAYTSLQSAIADLNDPKFGGPGEIWVAKGTYKPTTTTNQTISFVPPPQAQIYGGFAGNETARSARNWIANPTILSGEIGNPASVNDNTDIVVHYTGSSYLNDTVLDGFVVTRGNGGPAGGIVADSNASPVIRNCRIIDNQIGIRFTGNQAATPKLDNSIIAGNPGGGVLLTFTNASVTNCTVAHNTGATFFSGAGINVQASDPDIRNCLVFDNTGGGSIGQNSQIGNPTGDGSVTALISCCAIQFFAAGYANDIGCFAIGADGGCNDANGADNVFGTLDDDYSPAPCSDVIDSGDNAVSYPDTLDYDEDGNVTEALNIDIALGIRRVDLPVPNSGLGIGGIDVGAYERQALTLPDADFDNDGDVDGADLGSLLGAWDSINATFDLNGDCIINGADLGIFLGSWT